ncbi:MAG: GNAT family N-acetyltransferase [Bacteroidales bacterium]|nr:GNAT family N-acetyltransferase [Bacteroidales bacterium]
MIIVKNDDIDPFKWKNLLNASTYASPFQSEDFYIFYNSMPDYIADVFAISEEIEYTSLIVVTIQKERGVQGFFSKRGIIYGGPLIAGKNEKSTSVLLNEIAKYYKTKLIYIETRNFFDYSPYSSFFEEQNWNFLPYVNFTLTTDNKSMSELLSGMKYNRRREIKQSLEQKAFYKECETVEDLVSLYAILEDLYNSRVKLPFPELSFFLHLWQSNVGKVFIVIHEGKIIGGSFCVILEGKSIYTMYYCGLRKYNKKIYPTHLALIAALEYAINTKCKIMDLMGAGLKGQEYGVRNYKQEFGCELNEYGRYIKILNPLLYKIGIVGLKILKFVKK